MPIDYMTLKKFRETYPDLHGSMASLRWEVQNRQSNGLMDQKVILEVFATREKKRARILISPSRDFRWLGVTATQATA